MNELFAILIVLLSGFLAFFKKSKMREGYNSNMMKVQDSIARASRKSGVPEAIVASVAWQESLKAYNPFNVPKGSANEIGVMQLKQIAVDDLIQNGYDVEPIPSTDPEENILQGAYFLALQKKRAKNWFDTLRSYNRGFAGAMADSNAGRGYALSVARKAGELGFTSIVGTV